MTENIDLLATIDNSKLHVVFVGGCGAFGMNMTAYILHNRLYLVDVGLAFSADYEIGIDSYTPNINDLVSAFGGIEAYFITHGHEDHVGALPLILEKWPAPVFATSWTKEIIINRILKFGSKVTQDIHVVKPGDKTKTRDLNVDWIGVPHSIPGCCSLLIRTSDNVSVLHTGDFKFDLKPYNEPPIVTEALDRYAPITALISDSTNSQKDGRCPSEWDVIEPLRNVLKESTGKIVFTTFASNFWRLKIIIDLAVELGKKVYLSGASISKTLEIASTLKMFKSPEHVIIDDGQLAHTPDNKLIVLASGSQGEPRSGLRRIIFGEHKKIKLEREDTIILSSRVIPGNEKHVAALMSEAARQGVQVKSNTTHPGIHVSGHAYRQDLEDFIRVSKARFYIPVHGTFSQLSANSTLHENPIHVRNGSLIQISEHSVENLGELKFLNFYIDSWSQRPMDYETMRKRHKIGDSGMALVSGIQDNIEVEFVGLPLSESEKNVLKENIVNAIKGAWSKMDESALNEWARIQVRRILASLLVKKPVVYSRLYKSKSRI